MTFKHFFFVFVFFSCMVIDIQGGETSTFKNPATQILQLQKGWNLCALTIAPDADSIALLNNHGVCWGWKNGRFKLLDTFLPWQGFWMYSEENTKLNLTGEEASPTSLHPGWNLVGADSDIQENLSKDGWHAWHYDQNSYQRIHDTFTPGLGYWIFKPPVIKPIISYTLVPMNGMWRIDSGEWNDSGFVATTEIGTHTISFQTINGYTTPTNETITLKEGEKLSKTVEYAVIPPTITVTLNPATGKWRLDGGNWNDSGATVTTVVGEHTISFQTVDGYTTPTDETITLAAGEDLSKDVDYEAIPPTVTVTLNPANAKWRLDGGEWNDSGATVTTEVGTHTISFQTIDGYTTPAAIEIVLAAGEHLSKTVDYEVVPPTVTYTLNPENGKWRMDNGEWYDSGTTITTTAGSHRISFKAVDGYTTPATQNIVLTAGQNLSRTVNYTAKQPTVTYTLSPSSGKWRLDDGEWNKSGVTVTTTAGEHSISFDAVDGYTTPVAQNITLQMGESLSQNVAYEVILPTVTYTLDPPNGKWRIDDGEWNDSGATVTTTVGSHTISFMGIDGYTVPANQNLMMAAGRNTTRTANYTVIQPTVCYSLNPTTAKWRIDNGSWNDSGATVTTTVGNHKISFQAVDGYPTPTAQNIVLVAGENFSANVTYDVIPPTVTYTLNPPSGKWRLDNGAWNDSGATVTTTVGNHSVSFQSVTNYMTPVKQDITLVAGEHLTKLVTYEPIPPTVTYTLNPPSGKWRIDDGEWNASGVTVTTTIGEHTISFMNMLGYLEPVAQTIVLDAGKTYTYNVDYEKHDPLYVVVDLSSGPDSDHYPVRGTDTPPDLNDDTCRTTELWLRKIPAGTFMMGAPKGEKGICTSETQHNVTLTQDYYIGVFECTQRQWELVMGTRPSTFNNLDYYATRPVEHVSYNMIRGATSTDQGWPRYGHIVQDLSFMERLQTRTGLIFDLPTDAQWEYACRAGTTTALNSGKNLLNEYDDGSVQDVGRCGSNSLPSADCTDENGTAKVGSYKPNSWGLYDMHGNVNEWCLDWYDNANSDPTTDPIGPYTGRNRIVRGGAWCMAAKYCRSAYRGNREPTSIGNEWGFRIVYLHNSQPLLKCILNTFNGKWHLDNDDWNDNKETITTTAGEHVISYKDINMPGYFNLTDRTIILEMGHAYKLYDYYKQDDSVYVVVDLSAGPDAKQYPIRCTNTPPDLADDTCRTTELWLHRIKAGTFIMGSPEDEIGRRNTETQHKVTLTQDFFIGVFECTQRQWTLVMGNNPSEFIGDVRPVEHVSYNMIRGTSAEAGAGWPKFGHAVDATSFMGKLQTKTGLLFDLPTAAQWEYTCRAGTITALNSGENITSSLYDINVDTIARYKYNHEDGKGGYLQHTRVGSYLPNAWGLYDMHGNSDEWCLDWWSGNNGSSESVEDPVGSYSGNGRIVHGGGWDGEAFDVRAASFGSFSPSYVNKYFSFRIVYLP